MSEPDEKDSPLSEFKEQLDEVIELLNLPNIPIIVNPDAQSEGGDPSQPETPSTAEQK